MIDATHLAHNLFIGSAPMPGLREFNVIVLCADEYQPEASKFPGVVVEHFPFDDRQNLSKQEEPSTPRSVHHRCREVAMGESDEP